MDLRDKCVIYVGGFGGIGYASCQELLKQSIKALVIMDLTKDIDKLKQLEQDYANSEINYVAIDVTDKASVERAFETAQTLLSAGIDVVINGSGVYNDQQPELTVQVNLLGLINSTLTAYQCMDKSCGGQGGIILNISSVTGLEPNPLMAIYSATKAGIISFTRSLAHDRYYERSGIKVFVLCPGGTTTDLIMNPIEKCTFKFSSETHRRKNATSIKQSPEACAKCLVQLLATAENGSIWVCDLGQLQEIQMPVLWCRHT